MTPAFAKRGSLSLVMAAAASVLLGNAAQIQSKGDVQLTTPVAPTLVRIAGKSTLRYELRITNTGAQPIRIERIEVLDAQDRWVTVVQGGALGEIMPSVSEPLRPAGSAVAFMDLSATPEADLTILRHIVTVRDAKGSARRYSSHLRLSHRPLVRLDPPLRAGPWLAVYDPAMTGGHRRVFITRDGQARIPGRHAIDWMPAPGGAGVGAPVLAVADAVVVKVHDGVAEPAVGKPRPRVAVEDEAGNYVVLDLGNGRFAHYQHMLPSLAVQEGQRVSSGQVIGRLGSTGHVTQPHLHFHISNGPIALQSEGLPFALSRGVVTGSYRSVADAEGGSPWVATSSRKIGKIGDDVPPANSVVIFWRVLGC